MKKKKKVIPVFLLHLKLHVIATVRGKALFLDGEGVKLVGERCEQKTWSDCGNVSHQRTPTRSAQRLHSKGILEMSGAKHLLQVRDSFRFRSRFGLKNIKIIGERERPYSHNFYYGILL